VDLHDVDPRREAPLRELACAVAGHAEPGADQGDPGAPDWRPGILIDEAAADRGRTLLRQGWGRQQDGQEGAYQPERGGTRRAEPTCHVTSDRLKVVT